MTRVLDSSATCQAAVDSAMRGGENEHVFTLRSTAADTHLWQGGYQECADWAKEHGWELDEDCYIETVVLGHRIVVNDEDPR